MSKCYRHLILTFLTFRLTKGQAKAVKIEGIWLCSEIVLLIAGFYKFISGKGLDFVLFLLFSKG